jgi:hypothetical protein
MQESGAPPERVRLYTEPQAALALNHDTILHAVRDAAGLWLAYPSEVEALTCVPALPRQSVEAIHFGALLDRQPRALVHLHEQYYRANDLQGPPR